MREAVDQLIEWIRFAGVGVAFVGVIVTVVRAAAVSVAPGRSRRITDVGLDLARIVLVAIDLMLVAAILEVAMVANEVTLTRLGVVAGLRVGLTLLLAFEDAYRADTNGDDRRRAWTGAIRPRISRPNRLRPADQPVENVWADRARLGREGRGDRSKVAGPDHA
jgi:hypothetical protein